MALIDLDIQTLRFLNQDLTGPFMDRFAVFLSSITTWWVVGAVAFGLGNVLCRKKTLIITAALALSVGLTDVVCAHVLKPGFGRVRPCHELPGVRTLTGCGGRFGLPSNHAANGMAISAVAWVFGGPATGAVVTSGAALVGVSRVYLGVHYPGDVLAGFFIGAALGLILSLVFQRLLKWMGIQAARMG